MSKSKKRIAKIIKPYLLNLFKFTAPLLGLFFFQLSQGVELRIASLTVLYAFYSALSDLFKKYAEA